MQAHEHIGEFSFPLADDFPPATAPVHRFSEPAAMAEYLRFDAARSRPFHPHLDFNCSDPASDGLGLGHEAVDVAVRRHRQRRHAERLAAGWQGPRLLVDGDSWLHFPLVRDLVDQLEPDHAIDCLAGDGDPLRNPIRARRIGEAIVEQRPDAVLLSIGGGDVLDGARLSAFVEPFAPGRGARDYPNAHFIACLGQELMPRVLALLAGIRSIDARLPILLHSYAYARPRDFIWLGRPLRAAGIDDPGLQRAVVMALIDRFHTALMAGIDDAGMGNIHVVDCRDAVGAHWFDELHPNNAGFEAIAARFRATLGKLL